MDAVSIPRHSKRVNIGFLDAHAAPMKNSRVGFGLNGTDPGALSSHQPLMRQSHRMHSTFEGVARWK